MLCALLLFACTNTPADGPAATVLPELDDWGPWQVSTYEGSTESWGTEIGVHVWYPTIEDSVDLHRYQGIWESDRTLDGADADCSEPRPVAVFSHGNEGLPFQSYFITDYLASHGWVVVAPEHVHNTYLDADYDRMGEIAARRPNDVASAFDWAIAEPDLAGCVTPDAGYAVLGHSFGGFTTLAVAGASLDLNAIAEEGGASEDDTWLEIVEYFEQTYEEDVIDLSDSRAWAAVPLTPGGIELLGPTLGEVNVPVLVMGAEADQITTMDDQVTPIYEALGAQPRALAELRGADHYTYSNACELIPSDVFCDTELSNADAHPLIRTIVLAFLEQTRGRDDADQWLPPESDVVTWDSES